MFSVAGAVSKTDPATRVETEVGNTSIADGEDVSTRPVYGPIRARDPMVRAKIKHLYIERHELEQGTRAQIDALTQKLRAEADPDFRLEINLEIGQLKKDLELKSVELGLQIARLNEDEQRIADFELALDQLLHPEKYRAERSVDPALEQQRLREHGVK
jgi:hypothetical protein